MQQKNMIIVEESLKTWLEPEMILGDQRLLQNRLHTVQCNAGDAL